ncbi:double-strand break repair helicase AddA [Phaeovulum sp.]|uniref:double-strand break repair helicase AddA n=1 Tax=Phaeovulum sp. TaxID=2934796 RepID=UPI002731C0B1|nr:double-strand break repair helicase AddA [Phaeovulum sp.]MDP1669150.1 double-strand break repair helicase AddA [Phaeovulum sp.]MDZ4117789.1 double-strand break repair helicase AddA [Phaeovulum sp.]
MTRRSDASEKQVQAAAPAHSTWLAANAGSGKTRVLTDRVARLLLAGTEPQKVLCLTYTKAAASEMQNRLLGRLGAWAMLPDGELRAALEELGAEGPIDAGALARARRLFAKAIETPGGLKIQTIHAFCAGLLRRFPLEAGVPHDFAEMDERAGMLLRAEAVEELAAGADIGAVDALARHFPGDDLRGFLTELGRNSAAFDLQLTRAEALALFGLPAGFDTAALLREVFAGGEAALLTALVPILEAKGGNDAKAAAKLARLDLAAPDSGTCAALEGVLLYSEKAAAPFCAKIGSFPTKPTQKSAAALVPRLEALMHRVEAARARRIALAAAERTLALHRFAGAWLPRYRAKKAARGWLDFDDLILRASALLSDPSVAQWVLFRLDGGIDHILVDEAQDTSPGQWQVISALAAEFTAGEGARGSGRTLFVVGDAKQSIYSFQGADLAEFEAMRARFAGRFSAAGRPMQALELAHSFRSSPAILRLVDLTFDERVARGLGGPAKHIAYHGDMPGRVDLWQVVAKPDTAEDGDWRDPLDLRGERHEAVVLAGAIASEIRRLLEAGTRIADPKVPGGARALHEGDFLVLVQRRSALFAETIRACKAAGLAVAGADRLKLGAELAVRDITALLAFLATPEDDLSLAAALKSPLFGWTEAQLYALAAPRRGYLWEALRADAAEAETLAVLHDLRDVTDFLRPYELVERLLTRHGGRARLLARLGPEAEDGIDELLSQALAFEQSEVPSLTGFLGWLAADNTDVKRAPGAAGRAVRVMTVHGAKGLESPVVILPDSAKRKLEHRGEMLALTGGTAWKTPAAASPPEIVAARAAALEKEREERLRLLYVAMTRAEKWLIVCAAGDVGGGAESWYALVREAMEKAGAETVSLAPDPDGPLGRVQRLAFGDWPAEAPPETTHADEREALPAWARSPAPARPLPPPPLSPSDIGGAKALAGDEALGEEAAKQWGRRLHLLLQHLPDWPEAEWPELAAGLLAGGEDAAEPAETETVLAAAARVLRAPEMAAYLGPEALAEVEFSAALPELGGRRVHGVIDRLAVSAGELRLLDFKSNAVVPATPEDVPEGILRQMGAYAAALAQIYPGRSVNSAILWTETAAIMPLPVALLAAALDRAAHLDAALMRS